MRYYKIVITNADTGAPVRPSSLSPSTFTAGLSSTLSGLGGGSGSPMDITSVLSDGNSNPAALNIEFDLPIYNYVTPGGNGFLRIWGLSLADIGASFNLNGCKLAFYGGMSKGLPLANPQQQGLLLKGKIFQAFGNWINTDQTVDMYFIPDTGTVTTPKNFVMNWKAGTDLPTSLKETISTALPDAQVTVNVQADLKHNHDEVAVYGNLQNYSQAIYSLSKSIANDPKYAGVTISYDGTTLVATDQTKKSGTIKQIAFQDIIGQPTWKDPGTVQVKVVLRAGIGVGDIVNLPKTNFISNAAALTSLRGNLVFNGNYWVSAVHHYGNFRQPDAASWNTTLDIVPLRGALADGF